MLGLPFVFAKAGWFLGIFLLVLCGLMSIFSLHLLSICASMNPPASVRAVVKNTFSGPFSRFYAFFIDTAVVLQCIGCCVSYLIVIGNSMPDVLESSGFESGFWSRREVWVTIGFGIVTPLCWFEELDTLKYTSGISLVLVLFIAFIMMMYTLGLPDFQACDQSQHNQDKCGNRDTSLSPGTGVSQVFSILVFAFSCQPVIINLRIIFNCYLFVIALYFNIVYHISFRIFFQLSMNSRNLLKGD
jgi:amino acid permease